MSHQNPDAFDNLDDELRKVFTQAAAHVEPRSDLAATVQQRAAAGGSARMVGASRSLSIGATLSAVLVVALLAVVLAHLGRAGGHTGGSSSVNTGASTSTVASTAIPTATAASFTVSRVDLTVTPASLAGKACGSVETFTYTATFHVPVDSAGGVIHFSYTLNNGRSQTPATVTAAPGAAIATYTFTSSGALPADHTYPAPAIVMVTSPNSIQSPPATPTGACVAQGPFQVTSVSMAVSPASIAGDRCGSAVTVAYTATFHLAANGPGGTIRFDYTVNNGRSSTPASIAVAPGQTTASYSFRWSGALPADHTYPEPGGVMVQSPNAITSALVGPSGSCS